MKSHPFFAAAGRCALAGLFLATLAYGQGKPEAVRNLIERSITATGGREAMLAIKSRRARFVVSIPAMRLAAQMELVQEAPHRLYVKTEIPIPGSNPEQKMVEEVVFDGIKGWKINNFTGFRAISAEELESTRLQSDFYLLLEFLDRYPGAELTEGVDFFGATADLVAVEGPGKEKVKFFFNRETALLVGMEMVAVTDEMRMPATVQITDFLKQDGVVLPSRMVVKNPVSEMIMEMVTVTHNVEIPGSLFQPPATPARSQ